MLKYNFLTLVFFIATATVINAANIPLDIINWDKTGDNNRARWAYPGIKYEVPVAVEGGVYPLTYELVIAPSGMTINSSGIIEWDNPTVSGSPYSVTVKVADSENNTDTSSISITVTDSKSRFLFVDGSYSGEELGTLAQPYTNLEDVWTHTLSSGGGEVLYFRTGTYILPHSRTSSFRRDSYRIRVGPDATLPAPSAFLAYPGELVTIDMEKDSDAAVYKGYNFTIYGQPDIFFGGLIIDNAWSYAISAQSSAPFMTVYKCDFRNIEAEDPFDGNFSYINYMIADHSYNVIHSNKFGEKSSYIAPIGISNIKLYTSRHFVVLENSFHNLSDAIDLKDSTDYITFRRNKIYNTNFQAMGYSNGSLHSDVSFNFFYQSELSIYLASGRIVSNFWFYRNTLYDSYGYLRNIDNDDSVFMANNVIVYNQGDTGDVTTDSYWRNRVEYRYSPNVHNVQVVWVGGLYGDIVDNIINSVGELQGTYRDSSLGVSGWETSATDVLSIPIEYPAEFRHEAN